MIILKAVLGRLWPFLGYGAAALFFLLWLGARDEIVEERLACNASKISEALENERAVRAAQNVANEREKERLRKLLENAERAAEIARDAERLANERPERVKIVVRESDDACIDEFVPNDVLDSLFDP